MDVFDLVAKISLDDSEYRKGLGRAQQSTSTFGEVFKANIASGLVDKAFSGIVNGAKKGAEGLIALTKQAVSGYGDAEQLVGGVEKLYGDSASIVEKYAADAYKTSQMSANQYMETATQFSASLISSLGGDTQKAAEQTDVAMRAISDNVNVFGSNMEDVTNAFKGFSKQNYTMLDNLKLGYGGTKTEMERLISDANEYAASIGQASDLSIDSFSDIVTAIELIQEKQNIAGTTAKEAASTLQGSSMMFKTAWENLVSGISDPNADIGTLIDNVVSSAEAAIGNLLPVIERAINGIGTIITDLAPVIAEKLPALIEKIAPPILTAIGTLFGSIVQALPGLLQTISDAIPGLIKIITDALPEILPSLVEAIGILIDGIAKALPELIDQILDVLPELMKSIWDGLGKAFDNASPAGKIVLAGILGKTLGGGLVDAVGSISSSPLFGAAKKGFGKIIDLILPTSTDSRGGDALSGMFENATKAAGPLEEILPKIGGAFSSLGGIITGTVLPAIGALLTNPITWVISGIAAAIVGVIEVIKHWDEISKAIEETWEGIKEFFAPLGEFFSGLWDGIKEKTSEVWGNIKDGLSGAWEGIKGGAETVFGGIKDGISTAWDNVKENTSTAWDNIKGSVEEHGGGIKGVIGAATDAYKSIWSQGFNFIDSLTGGKLSDMVSTVRSKMGDFGSAVANALGGVRDGFGDVIGKAFSWGKDLIDNFVNGIKKVANKVGDAVKGVAGKIKDLIGFSEPKEGPLSNFHTFGPDMMDLYARGINDNVGTVTDAAENAANAISGAFNGDKGSLGITVGGGGAFGPAGTTLNAAPITINVYGAEGQNVQELADIVADRINQAVDRERLVFA